MKYIIFGFEHYNPLGIARSLGENGINPYGIIIKNSRKITSKSKDFKQVFFVNSIEEGYNLLKSRFTDDQNFIFSSDDQVEFFLDEHYDELQDRFIFFNAGQKGRVAYFQNKYNILKMAEKHGIPFLKTWTVDKGEIPEDIQYPIITKAIISTLDNWKGDMIICHNENDLRNAYKVIRSPKVLLQKYIVKKNELCMEGCSVNRGEDVLISIASTYNYKLDDSYSPYMTVSNLENDELRKKLKEMIADIGFEGIFEIEFLIDKDDSLYFLEVNFRNSTWSYASTVAGMPLPVIWSDGMLGKVEVSKCEKKIECPFKAMVEFDDYRRRVKSGMVSKKEWFRDFRNAKCKYYIGKRDIHPFLSVCIHKVGKTLHIVKE